MLNLICIISLVTLGLHYCYWYTASNKEGEFIHWFAKGARVEKDQREILWFIKFYIGSFIYNHLPMFRVVLKPLFTCPMCMPSFYGTMIYWSQETEISLRTILKWLAVLVATTGLNRIITAVAQL